MLFFILHTTTLSIIYIYIELLNTLSKATSKGDNNQSIL